MNIKIENVLVSVFISILVFFGGVIFAKTMMGSKPKEEPKGPEILQEKSLDIIIPTPDSCVGLVHIVEIEGCEYIKTRVHFGVTYCHKGNCKNPIHSYKKE